MAKKTKSTTGNNGVEIIESLIQDKQGLAWLKEQIYDEGPPHKQAQHTLVLERLNVLVHQYESKKDIVFKPVTAENIILEKHDHSLELPLGFPAVSLAGNKDLAFVERLTKGPDHEIAYTAVLLHAIEWMIEHNNGG